METTKPGPTNLREIFVFGSNLAGLHKKGAAKWAHQAYGAIMGQGIGLQGRSYAIPTKGLKVGLEPLPILPRSIIAEHVYTFCQFAITHEEYTFLLTPIGCGLAGYTPQQIAPLFKQAWDAPNIIFPAEFKVIIERAWTMVDIVSFSGINRWLSNFYPRAIEYNAVRFKSNEHAFQANKFLHLPLVFELIRDAAIPGEAKRIARKYNDHVLPEWYEGRRVEVMRGVLREKFAVPYLRELLLGTHPVQLIEGNTWKDTFWGQCPLGNGENMLGRLLMELREEIRNGQQ